MRVNQGVISVFSYTVGNIYRLFRFQCLKWVLNFPLKNGKQNCNANNKVKISCFFFLFHMDGVICDGKNCLKKCQIHKSFFFQRAIRAVLSFVMGR